MEEFEYGKLEWEDAEGERGGKAEDQEERKEAKEKRAKQFWRFFRKKGHGDNGVDGRDQTYNSKRIGHWHDRLGELKRILQY